MINLLAGDCVERLAELPLRHFHGCITDPPYNLESITARFGQDGAAPAQRAQTGVFARKTRGFMGEAWDSDVAFQRETWAAIRRVLRPGAFVLSFCGTRNYHRMATAIEQAGLIVLDMIQWQYGSGMPHNHNVAKAALRNAKPEVATLLEGTGTVLKPAQEVICVAMNPRRGTIIENLLRYHTGVLNIRDCRIGTEEELRGGAGKLWSHYRDGEASRDARYDQSGATDFRHTPGPRGGDPLGRWPANIIHDGSEEATAGYPAKAGQKSPVRGTEPSQKTASPYGKFTERLPSEPRLDTGSAARFFYCAKARASERVTRCPVCQTRYMGRVERCCGAELEQHATVKPLDLMEWLVRLITPIEGARILDPFAGTGSTAIAAAREGVDCTLVESDPRHQDDILFRLRHSGLGDLVTVG